ncbi:MAG: hypothetical protein Cpurp_13320 [Chlorogloea purpurea SAG 13.99]|nr:hypothetical protein [Chlorogloea purpurea SAG 13.99]
MKIPSFLILPSAALVSTAAATYFKSQEPDPEKLAQKEVERELLQIKSSSLDLAVTAKALQQEAGNLLSRDSENMDLLISLQEACYTISEIPPKIDELQRQLPKTNSVLSIATLEENLRSARNLLASSDRIAKEGARELVRSLERNLELAKTGSSANLAKVLNVRKMINDVAGVLQEIQNKIRYLKRGDGEQIKEIEALCDRLKSLRDNFDILIN